MQIKVRQIDQLELSSFVSALTSGANFSGSILGYAQVSGFYGNHVVYITGQQSIQDVKTFLINPELNYTGSTGSAISRGAVLNLITGSLLSFSGFTTGGFVDRSTNQSINGLKVFNSAVTVANPTLTGHAVNLNYLSGVSGVLNTAISNVSVSNVVHSTGNELISGQKRFVQSPLVPTPTDPSGAVPLSYVTGLSISNTVFTTGDQTISGIKTFVQSPIVPIATSPTEAVRKSQLDALGTTIGGVTGFAGVISINGTSGASGHVYLEGAGTVTVTQCDSIFYISGITANNTQLYSASQKLPSGITGIAYTFNSGFNSKPSVVGTLEVSGNVKGEFIDDYVFNVTTGGFNVAFSSGIPTSGNYFYNFNVIPIVSGSGFFGLQGAQGNPGRTPNARGAWQAGLTYGVLDFVYRQPNSYIATQTNISDSFNIPSGTGNAYWQIFNSGSVGDTGAWVYQGDFNTGIVFKRGYSTTYDDSSFGFSGNSPVSGILPTTLTGGWHYIAKKAPIGIFINSGIITGNFVNLSMFLEPVGTGLNLAESFTSRNFTLTGYVIGCVDSGRGPALGSVGIMSGNLYTRDLSNTKTVYQTFTFDSGLFSYVSGGLAVPITGLHRLGIDITNSLSGISKLAIGLFGFGGNDDV